MTIENLKQFVQMSVFGVFLSTTFMLIGCTSNNTNVSNVPVNVNNSSVDISDADIKIVENSIFTNPSDDFSEDGTLENDGFTHLLSVSQVYNELKRRGFNESELVQYDDETGDTIYFDASDDANNIPQDVIEIFYRPKDSNLTHWNFEIIDGCLTARNDPATSKDDGIVVVLTETDYCIFCKFNEEREDFDYYLNGLDDFVLFYDENGEIAGVDRPVRVGAITPETLAKYDETILKQIRGVA